MKIFSHGIHVDYYYAYTLLISIPNNSRVNLSITFILEIIVQHKIND